MYDANSQRYIVAQQGAPQQMFYPMVMPIYYPPPVYGMPLAAANTPSVTQVGTYTLKCDRGVVPRIESVLQRNSASMCIVTVALGYDVQVQTTRC